MQGLAGYYLINVFEAVPVRGPFADLATAEKLLDQMLLFRSTKPGFVIVDFHGWVIVKTVIGE